VFSLSWRKTYISRLIRSKGHPMARAVLLRNEGATKNRIPKPLRSNTKFKAKAYLESL